MADSELMERLVVSKERVAGHGEVLTGKREVNAMLDMVKKETERIESRFLEPACGTGNFLTEILERKLRIVESRYSKSQLEYERYAVLAVSSVYGIDLLPDNIVICRRRLLDVFDEKYVRRFKKKAKEECRNSVKYILERNIIVGDARTLKTVGTKPQPIVFSEWSPLRGSMLKRRDFAFHELLPKAERQELPLFSHPHRVLRSDLGDAVFIPMPVKEYPLTHFLKVGDVQ